MLLLRLTHGRLLPCFHHRMWVISRPTFGPE